jgi:glyoxalase/bleomycin resistance protein/dioxygenase superfamily protein
MPEPAFNETLQLGIVVRDLEATMRRYVDDHGIGPWEVHEFDAGEAEDFREYGQPVERSWRLAVAMVGQVMWELIQPIDDESVYARFLAEKGEGVHHVAVAASNFDETVAQADRGNGVILSGEFGGAKVASLGTERDLGVIIEIFSGTPGRGRAAGRDLALTVTSPRLPTSKE